MDREDFKQSVKECVTLLQAVATVIPRRVEPELITYLVNVQSDPVGLEVLQNALPKSAEAKS